MQLSFPRPLPFCMVIDPSITVCKVLATELKRAQYSCVTFADPIEAVRAVMLRQIQVPDVALVCWSMPHFDGIAVLGKLKEARVHTVSVMLMDANENSPLNRVKARLAGAQSTLAKPFTMQQFHHTLTSIKFTY